MIFSKCPICNRVFTLCKNVNTNIRRHISKQHPLHVVSHVVPLKNKWDSHPLGRVKTEEERVQRSRTARRLWARKNRAWKRHYDAALVLEMLSRGEPPKYFYSQL